MPREKWIIKVETKKEIGIIETVMPYNSDDEYDEIKEKLFAEHGDDLVWYSIEYSSK